jgi:hypothetical protein
VGIEELAPFKGDPVAYRVISVDQLVGASNRLWGQAHYGVSFLNIRRPTIGAELSLAECPVFRYECQQSTCYEFLGERAEFTSLPDDGFIETWIQSARERALAPYSVRAEWADEFWRECGDGVAQRSLCVETGAVTCRGVGLMIESWEPLGGTAGKGFASLVRAAGITESELPLSRLVHEVDSPLVYYDKLRELIEGSSLSPCDQELIFYQLWSAIMDQAGGSRSQFNPLKTPEMMIEGAVWVGDPTSKNALGVLTCEYVALESIEHLIDGLLKPR